MRYKCDVCERACTDNEPGFEIFPNDTIVCSEACKDEAQKMCEHNGPMPHDVIEHVWDKKKHVLLHVCTECGYVFDESKGLDI